ncbi:MAG: YibE/F family protein, partial [Patescibacteria group bacterium]|nr:YibE/F family protein [Patescibacteria group bacterium]
ILLLFIFVSFSFFFLSNSTIAQNNTVYHPQEEKLESVVTKILEEREVKHQNTTRIQQIIEVLVTKGSKKGTSMIIGSNDIPLVNDRRYTIGDRLLISATKDVNNQDIFFVVDYIRRDILFVLFGIFVFLTFFIGRIHGVLSLIGMIYSFFIIFSFILPQIHAGKNPIWIAVMGSMAIIPVTFYLSHGFNKKTTLALISTLISVCITGALAAIFLELGKLSGFSSEEAGFLESIHPGKINIQGLLLAGILISVLGILDDVTVSQASIVAQLKETAPYLSHTELYRRAMNVGRDHIASVVNTLILVYTGASLPLLILFIDNPAPFSEVINYEIIAQEIIQTLVSSIGLILSVPITTALSSRFIKENLS